MLTLKVMLGLMWLQEVPKGYRKRSFKKMDFIILVLNAYFEEAVQKRTTYGQ